MSNHQKALEFANAFRSANGFIVSPGKFEGEPVYAAYFYYFLMKGDGDIHENSNATQMEILSSDEENFPELKGSKYISLYFSNHGFICSELHDDDRT